MGSGIIFNNGGGGGGTTINPTNNFIPVRSNATTFVDSCLWQVNADVLRTVFGGTVNGLDIDHSNRSYQLGQLMGENNTYISVNDVGSTIKSYSQGNPFGFYIDRNSYFVAFGDYLGGNNTFLSIDTFSFLVSFYVNSNVFFNINGNQSEGYFGISNSMFAFELNNGVSAIGDYYGSVNSNYIFVDDLNGNLNFQAQSELRFFGPNLITPSAGGASGDHLRVVINGNNYVIALLNP